MNRRLRFVVLAVLAVAAYGLLVYLAADPSDPNGLFP